MNEREAALNNAMDYNAVEKEEILKNIATLIEEHKMHIELNEKMKQLQKTQAYKDVIDMVFLENGKKYLWENIKEFEEAELLGKGSTREGSIAALKTELQARLIFERFINSFAVDAEHAKEAIEEAEAYREALLNPTQEEI